jgi:exosortase/archaeosortase family protein
LGKKKKNTNIQKPRPEERGFSHKSVNLPVLETIKSFWVQNKRVISPALLFFVIVGAFIYLYSIVVVSPPFHSFMAFTANITGIMLNLTGRGVTVNDLVVTSPQFSFKIVDLCTAIMPMMIFTAAVLAFPSRLKEKSMGLIIGLFGIFIINQIRLVSLFYIGIYVPGIFETAHLLIWQSLMILVAIGLWLIWVYKYVRSYVN